MRLLLGSDTWCFNDMNNEFRNSLASLVHPKSFSLGLVKAQLSMSALSQRSTVDWTAISVYTGVIAFPRNSNPNHSGAAIYILFSMTRSMFESSERAFGAWLLRVTFRRLGLGFEDYM